MPWSAMPAWASTTAHVGVAQRQVGQRVHRRHPATGVDEDRDLSLLRDPPDRVGPVIAEPERLRPRMQLDPARAEPQATLGLRHRILGRVEAAVRVQAPVGLARPPQHPVVGNPVARGALGIVKRERAGPRGRSHLIEKGDQARRVQRLAVLIPTQVGVRVDDQRAGGEQRADLVDDGLVGRGEIHTRDARRRRPRRPVAYFALVSLTVKLVPLLFRR